MTTESYEVRDGNDTYVGTVYASSLAEAQELADEDEDMRAWALAYGGLTIRPSS
jgi:hypothetical protein